MEVIYAAPSARISDYVRGILIINNEQGITPFTLPLFANGTPTLLFTTAPGRIGQNQNHLTLFGQTVAPQQLLVGGKFMLIAYFLEPYALSALFNLPAFILTDKPIELGDLASDSPQLQELLLNVGTTELRLQLIDEYLFKKIEAVKMRDDRLAYAAKKIFLTPNNGILTAVQQELHITERTFQRLFEQYIGVSPNLFRRINQFNQAFGQINKGHFHNLSSVAYQHGYADQSHLNRAFKEFTDMTPVAYLQTRP